MRGGKKWRQNGEEGKERQYMKDEERKEKRTEEKGSPSRKKSTNLTSLDLT